VEAWAIVVAAGSGVRFGQPKQYVELAGRPVMEWAIDGARGHCEGVVVVVREDDVETLTIAGADAIVPGGETRSASVRAGLAAVPARADVIAVHDAVRPLASADLWARVLQAVATGADAAVPTVAVTETIKRVDDDTVIETLDRHPLVVVQTPQAFRAGALRAAHAAAGDATDDAALVEAAGGRVVTVPGDRRNLKITDPADLDVAGLWLEGRA
jgi:2-C-methyl-D-erythritol 4-phosphate cytidylyltransferase